MSLLQERPVLPNAKVWTLSSFHRKNGPLCVAIGRDSVNDAPALARADLGIAFCAETKLQWKRLTRSFVKSALSDVVVVLHLSSAIFRRIQLNFLCSLGYKCPWHPLAAGVLLLLIGDPLTPWVSESATAMSSVSVIASSLLLQRSSARATAAALNRGAGISRCWKDDDERCWHFPSTEVALGRNGVQQARETVINGITGTCGLRWVVLALANKVGGLVAPSEFEIQQGPFWLERAISGHHSQGLQMLALNLLVCGHKCLMCKPRQRHKGRKLGGFGHFARLIVGTT